jgi:hypothetical protein
MRCTTRSTCRVCRWGRGGGGAQLLKESICQCAPMVENGLGT